jgi:DNA-binding transcriptional LysR family regulator
VDKLQLMATYVQVLKSGSFSAAAGRLRVSRAVITKHVAKLEDVLGARLLNRTTRRLHATEIGVKYFEFCNKLLSEIAEAEADVASLQQKPAGDMRVAVPKAFGSLHMGEAVADFCRAYPQIGVSTSIIDFPLEPRTIFENGFDVAIRLSRPQDSSIVSRQVCKLTWVVCASPGYLGRLSSIAKPSDLSQHNCLLHRKITAGGVWLLNGHGAATKIRVRGNLSSNSAMVLRAAAIADAGVSVLPLYCVAADLADGRLVRILPEYVGHEDALFILFPHRRQPHRVRLFIEFLAKRFRASAWSCTTLEKDLVQSPAVRTRRKQVGDVP